jgi:hypothetical protein
MATVKNKFETVELDWAEKQLKTWQAYIDANPFEAMIDRTKLRPTKGGGTVLEVVATIEAQQKNIRDMMKDYLALYEIVKRLRRSEDDKGPETGRGGEIVPLRMA